MEVRLGTSMGINLAHVTHWTYEETAPEPPEPPNPPVAMGTPSPVSTPSTAPTAPVSPTSPTSPDEGRAPYEETELPATAPKPDAQESQPVEPTSAPSTSLDPATAMAEAEGVEPVGTLTVYFAGSPEPLVLTGDDAKAVLGVFVSNSGSIT